jgi:hypothetical protein
LKGAAVLFAPERLDGRALIDLLGVALEPRTGVDLCASSAGTIHECASGS